MTPDPSIAAAGGVAPGDAFEDLARFYECIMDHVNYDRWFRVSLLLADLLDTPFRHLDAACGTGTLLREGQKLGWNSVGVDLSPAMLRAGRKQMASVPFAVADLRALPFSGGFDLITCLFDSVNFILEEEGVAAALSAFYHALNPGGLLYFDAVTERMVVEHFEGQYWTEDNGRFRTTWTSQYDRNAKIVETRVRVNTGAGARIRERVYEVSFLQRCLETAGFKTLAVADAKTWRRPGRKTMRVDFVAWKSGGEPIEKQFKKVLKTLRAEGR